MHLCNMLCPNKKFMGRPLNWERTTALAKLFIPYTPELPMYPYPIPASASKPKAGAVCGNSARTDLCGGGDCHSYRAPSNILKAANDKFQHRIRPSKMRKTPLQNAAQPPLPSKQQVLVDSRDGSLPLPVPKNHGEEQPTRSLLRC